MAHHAANVRSRVPTAGIGSTELKDISLDMVVVRIKIHKKRSLWCKIELGKEVNNQKSPKEYDMELGKFHDLIITENRDWF